MQGNCHDSRPNCVYRLRRFRCPPGPAAPIASRMARALDYGHQTGAAYRYDYEKKLGLEILLRLSQASLSPTRS